MVLKAGLVGLPNVGKSTIFNALVTGNATIGNFPFCTIEPTRGYAAVRDTRLATLARLYKPQNIVHTGFELTDIAGLVQGASKGEGLGNRFLATIQECSVLIHVLRCFESENISHVCDTLNPLRDFQIVQDELILADLEKIERRIEKQKKQRGNKREEQTLALFDALYEYIQAGNPTESFLDSLDPLQREWGNAELGSLFLFTQKPFIILCNVAEDLNQREREWVEAIEKQFPRRVEIICGKLEAELAGIESSEERSEFLHSLGIAQSGFERVTHRVFDELGLASFFTAGPKEVRAWAFRRGISAQQAAGIIHSDFEKGFVKADIFSYSDIAAHGSEKTLRELGKIRQEGRNYEVIDGDVVLFRWNL